MAAKVQIVGTTTHLKRVVAQMFVRQAVAVWVVQNVSLRMLKPGEMCGEMGSKCAPGLPPVEGRNCKFRHQRSENETRSHLVLVRIAREISDRYDLEQNQLEGSAR